MSAALRWTLGGTALAVAGALLWWSNAALDPARWPIRWLEVEGDLERVTAAQVRAAVADHAVRGFFAVDIERARVAVEALPWVARAAVGRRWPDALVITLEEQRAVARFNDSALVSSQGELFRVAGTGGMQGLARLYGPEARSAEIFGQWQRARAMLTPVGLEPAALRLDPRGAWTLVLADGRELLLGRDAVEARLARFVAVLPELAGIEDLVRIDLRYPNGLAVTRAGPAARLAEDQRTSGDSSDHG